MILLSFSNIEELCNIVSLKIDKVLVALNKRQFTIIVDAFPSCFEGDLGVFDFCEDFLTGRLDNFGETDKDCVEIS